MSAPRRVGLAPRAEAVQARVSPALPRTTYVSPVGTRRQIRRRVHAAVVAIPKSLAKVQHGRRVRVAHRLNPGALPADACGLSYQPASLRVAQSGGIGGSAFDYRNTVNPGSGEFSERDLSSGHG